MNQLEYESLFIEADDKLKNLPQSVKTFSQGNHKRSLVGEKWFYYGETTDTFTLFRDEVVAEDEDFVFIDIYEDQFKQNPSPIALNKEHYGTVYPAQDLFPYAMEEDEALTILKDHFLKTTDRSTTIERVG